MAKKKKNRRAEAAVAAQKKQFPVKRALFILFSTLVSFTLYQTVNLLEANAGLKFPIITTVYFAAATVLICLIAFFNRGFSTKPVTVEMLLEAGVAAEDANKICQNLNRHKQIARKLMLALLPIVLTILLDLIYLFYGDFFVGAIEFITGGGK